MTKQQIIKLLYVKEGKLQSTIDICRIAADNGNTLPALVLIDELSEAIEKAEGELK